jgi:hypothetical protein
MGRTSKSLPSISPAFTSYSDSRVRNVSLKRITSDQFSLLQTGSMDVSGDQEQDRIHLRDLLTCSVRSLVSPVRGRKAGEFSDLANTKKRVWARHFTAIQRHAIQKTSQACLKHTQAHPNPLPPAPRLTECRSRFSLRSEPPQRSLLRRRACSLERRRFQPSRSEYASSRL